MNKVVKLLVTVFVIALWLFVFVAFIGAKSKGYVGGVIVHNIILFYGLIGALKTIWRKKDDRGQGAEKTGDDVDEKEKEYNGKEGKPSLLLAIFKGALKEMQPLVIGWYIYSIIIIIIWAFS